MNKTEQIMSELKEAGYDSALAFATQAEVENGSACGQLAIITEELDKEN